MGHPAGFPARRLGRPVTPRYGVPIMKLTVGPLPSAVYWRRRAGVLGALLLTLFVLFYSCAGGSPDGDEPRAAGSASAVASVAETTSTAAAPASAYPSAPSSGDVAGAASAAPDAQTCTDAEITVTAVPEVSSAPSGSYVKFSLKIKNISARSCSRDIGADAQELYLQDAANAKVWSSDTCDAPHGSEIKTFEPAFEVAFFVVWNGRTSSAGCTNRPVAPPGQYQLLGRLASKVSGPAPVQLT